MKLAPTGDRTIGLLRCKVPSILIESAKENTYCSQFDSQFNSISSRKKAQNRLGVSFGEEEKIKNSSPGDKEHKSKKKRGRKRSSVSSSWLNTGLMAWTQLDEQSDRSTLMYTEPSISFLTRLQHPLGLVSRQGRGLLQTKQDFLASCCRISYCLNTALPVRRPLFLFLIYSAVHHVSTNEMALTWTRAYH